MNPDPPATPDAPFQILVLGPFSGRRHGEMRNEVRVGRRDPLRLETVDALMERLAPVARVGGGEEALRLDFREMEDFHPDRLLSRVPELEDRFRDLDRIVEEAAATEDAEPDGAAAQGAEGESVPGGPGLLDDIVADATGERPPPREPAGERPRESGPVRELRSWIGEVVSPHVEPGTSARQEELRARLEADLARRLRDVLHAPEVRELEALWRSLLLLASTAGASPDVRIFVLDVSRDELDSMLAEEGRSEAEPSSVLRAALLEAPPGTSTDTPWAVTVAAFDFGPQPRDVLLVNRLAMLARETGIPLLAGAAPTLLGMDAFHPEAEPVPPEQGPELWRELRSTPAVQCVSLLAPGFLLRMPYGPDTDPCGRLDVREVPEEGSDAAGVPDRRDRYLWGNPAFVGAAALGLAFARDGWAMDPSPVLEMEGRPIHVDRDGRVRAHPVERVWRVDEARRVRESGIVPLLAFREAARFRLPGLPSASRSQRPLAAWWAS